VLIVLPSPGPSLVRAWQASGEPVVQAIEDARNKRVKMGHAWGAPKVRFAMDSPLEGGVSCELVSENAKIPC